MEIKAKKPNGWMDRRDIKNWPMPLVDQARWEQLDEADLTALQQMINAFITQREAAAATSALPTKQKLHGR